jgi:hypothetical protein
MSVTLIAPGDILAHHIGLKDIQIINQQYELEQLREQLKAAHEEVERVKKFYNENSPPVHRDDVGGELRREFHHTAQPVGANVLKFPSHVQDGNNQLAGKDKR